MDPNPRFKFEFTLAGLSRSQAEWLWALIVSKVDILNGSVAGGPAECDADGAPVAETPNGTAHA